ncbi:flagellar hook-length control protein FliK [Chitinibacteraceae bacterium HSL-7]
MPQAVQLITSTPQPKAPARPSSEGDASFDAALERQMSDTQQTSEAPAQPQNASAQANTSQDEAATDAGEIVVGDSTAMAALWQALLGVQPQAAAVQPAVALATSQPALSTTDVDLVEIKPDDQGETGTAKALEQLSNALSKGSGKGDEAASVEGVEIAANGKVLPGQQVGVSEGEADTAPVQVLATQQPTKVVEPAGVNNVAKTHQVAEPVASQRWGDVVAQRVSMMVGRQEQHIEMQLNPPHLGPMEVRLSVAADNASVFFASQHAAVREALAAATPKLTALLADQGIQLVDVKVASDSLNQQAQQQSAQQNQAQQQRGQMAAAASRFDAASWSAAGGEVSMSLPVARSGVSFYA